MFIADYIKTKYSSLYAEAALMYNEINNIYPKKPDLRKTYEYRRWENDIARQNNMPIKPIPRQRPSIYNNTLYPNITIEVSAATTYSPPQIPIDLSNTEIVMSDEPATTQNPIPRNPTSPAKQSPVRPGNKRTTKTVMQLNIPLIPTTMLKTTQQSVPSPTPSTCETVVDEGDQVNDLNPSVFDTIPDETIENLIQELRDDPDLSQIMNDIENDMNVEEEIIGLTLDLPDPCFPLEEELSQW